MQTIEPAVNGEKVRFREKGRASLLAFVLKNVLTQSFETRDDTYPAIRNLNYKVLVQAASMRCTLAFDRGVVFITSGMDGPIAASIRGEFGDLLSCLEGVSPVKLVLLGKLKVGGNPFKLLPLMKIFSAS
ncbi:MAG: hypothetical protein NUW37_04705 [Planctomycetes bacterium]|nr:hypothetical protein [Planctomycetota bacterium]